jgi:1,4-dihydroxy-6-naphthoate synthase
MQLSLGFSPCPNDTFMLDALIHHRIPSKGIEWNIFIEDVETLNRWAMQERLDVSKMSFNAWLHVRDKYTILSSGAALGHGCGPLIIARESLSEDEILKGPVAIPGELTTANLLFSLRYPKAAKPIPMVFSEIETAVLDGRVVAGVIIHENRFTYSKRGLVKILDLGEYWEQETGFPIPLGAIAVKNTLGPQVIEAVDQLIHESVRSAFDNPDTAMPFVRKHAQEMDDNVMQAHIRTYVNEFSLDLGSQGLEAIHVLRDKAIKAGLIS